MISVAGENKNPIPHPRTPGALLCLLAVEAPSAVTPLEGVLPLRAQPSFAECLICNTQALPGQAPTELCWVGLPTLPSLPCSCQVSHQDRTRHTPPWWLSRDLLAFPWVSKGGGRLWEKLDEGRLLFPLLLLSILSGFPRTQKWWTGGHCL